MVKIRKVSGTYSSNKLLTVWQNMLHFIAISRSSISTIFSGGICGGICGDLVRIVDMYSIIRP